MLKNVSSREAIDLMRAVEDARVDKYGAKQGSENLSRLLKLLGPLGQIIGTVIGRGGSGGFGSDQLEAAKQLIRSFGGEALVKPGERGFGRGLEAAKQLVSESIQPPPISRGSTSPVDDDDEEISIQTLGRGSIGYDDKATGELIGREIRVESSNVYSFVYELESARSGILYVTFLAWTPGSKKRAGAGPTYAYYDVTRAKYNRFATAATNQSAGEAVWDYLRERGSVWGHQHQYRIVGGVLLQDGGQYVPRKATRGGFKGRSVVDSGVGRRGATRSSLPERAFAARGTPDLPNRGRPNRAEPNRGR